MNSFFGTDGIRAAVGTALFTQQHLPTVAQAIAAWLKTTHAKNSSRPRIVIIHDTRNSCAYIKSVFKMVFLANSIDVYDAGVLPTPAATYLLQKYDFDCALVISASHNAWHDNGIKIIDRSGKLTADAETAITAAIQQPQSPEINYHNLGQETIIDGVSEYKQKITKLFKPHFLEKLKIVLDCAHGATAAGAPAIFEYFGAQVIAINTQPDGFNINAACGAVHLEALQAAVRKHDAHIGFAFDGDGDRVIAVNRHGVIKNGDDIIALLSRHPDYQKEPFIVGTIMSNIGFEVWLGAQGKKLIRTTVGDKYVAQALTQQHALLGGEQSGHIILKNYTNTGDGILVALKVLETIILLENYDFETFKPYPQVLLTIPVKRMCDLSESPYEKLIQAAQQLIPSGRISVRYSGTEKNMLRIMVESELLHDADTIAHNLADSLQRELS